MSEQVFQLAFQFLEQEPRAAARLLEERETEPVIQFLINTPAPTAARVLREMQPEYSAQLLTSADADTAQLWMKNLRSRILSAMLRRADPAQQQQLLDGLTLKKKAACQLLLSFREDMVGAIIETDIIVFPLDMSAEDGLKRLKQREYREDRKIYVVTKDRVLHGEFSVLQLLHASSSITMGDLSRPCKEVLSSRSLIRSAVSHPLWQNQDVAPVINRQRELIGVLWYSQLRDALSSSTKVGTGTDKLKNPIVDLLHAHGDSMRAMLDTLLKVGV